MLTEAGCTAAGDGGFAGAHPATPASRTNTTGWIASCNVSAPPRKVTVLCRGMCAKRPFLVRHELDGTAQIGRCEMILPRTAIWYNGLRSVPDSLPERRPPGRRALRPFRPRHDDGRSCLG